MYSISLCLEPSSGEVKLRIPHWSKVRLLQPEIPLLNQLAKDNDWFLCIRKLWSLCLRMWDTGLNFDLNEVFAFIIFLHALYFQKRHEKKSECWYHFCHLGWRSQEEPLDQEGFSRHFLLPFSYISIFPSVSNCGLLEHSGNHRKLHANPLKYMGRFC